MRRWACALLLLAPVWADEPVGPAGWERDREPISRRLASLIAGEPVRAGSVTLVPLFARVPSEAGRAWADEIETGAGEARGTLQSDTRLYMRIHNPGERRLLVLAGASYRKGPVEWHVTRSAVIPPRFTALLPVAERAEDEHAASKRGPGIEALPPLPPLVTGAFLHDDIQWEGLARWIGPSHAAALSVYRVRVKQRLLVDTARKHVYDARGGTSVGFVALVGSGVVGAHVFGTHELLLDAMPGLLHGIAAQAYAAEANDPQELQKLAETCDAHGRAVAFLRNLLDVEGKSVESYGAGFDTTLALARDRVIGQAVRDHRGRVVHVAFYGMGGAWPGRPETGNGATPDPGRPPSDGGSETAPGVVERSPRPSLSDARERGRKPR